MPEWWTNRSRLPSSGVMKPKPLSSLNHFTVPVAILSRSSDVPGAAFGGGVPTYPTPARLSPGRSPALMAGMTRSDEQRRGPDGDAQRPGRVAARALGARRRVTGRGGVRTAARALAAAAAFLALAGTGAAAQPSVRLTVSFTPGGGAPHV